MAEMRNIELLRELVDEVVCQNQNCIHPDGVLF